MLKFESQIFILFNLYHMFIIIFFHYSIIIGCSKQINTHLTKLALKVQNLRPITTAFTKGSLGMLKNGLSSSTSTSNRTPMC